MILHENATFQAKLHMGNLVVTDRSPDLPPLPKSGALITYLNQLSVQSKEHWRADRMHFDGFTLTVHLQPGDPDGNSIPHYFIQTLVETPALGMGAGPYDAKKRKTLAEKLKEGIAAEGWHELATSKPLADLLGAVFVISIWIKD